MPGTPQAWQRAYQHILADIAAARAEVSVVVSTLGNQDLLRIEDERVYHAASTMKIAVMMALFMHFEQSTDQPHTQIALPKRFYSIVDGSKYSLAIETEQEAALHEAESASLLALCEAMIIYSSNLATNILMDYLGIEAIRAVVRQIGTSDMDIQRGLEDIPAFEQGLNNTTTARALAILLQHLGRLETGTAASSEAMLSIMKRQFFRDAIPAGLPAGVVVAHKTGEITRHHHDAGIVFLQEPLVVVILTRGLLRPQSAALIAGIAGRIHHAATS